VPIIAQARFREAIHFDKAEGKLDFLARARLALLGGVETGSEAR
jgi:hypothetical protein